MKRVCYEINGKIYKGEPIPAESAGAWVKKLNAEYPYHHWTEPA